ncbi:MAG TPA: hypothetical protein PKD10_05275 [Paracoccaceae bacterium]|nr:hypothetical protein [Paracoccaceae bacterium]HMO70104.1 hypothetical protein [Paracoccaceae bacterium]
MDWLLVIVILSTPGQPAAPMGLMADRRACAIAGAGMVHVLARANPGMTFGWRCLPPGVSS